MPINVGQKKPKSIGNYKKLLEFYSFFFFFVNINSQLFISAYEKLLEETKVTF